MALTSVPRNLVTCLKYLPADSSTLVQGGEDLKLRVWDVRGGLVQVQTIECIYFPVGVRTRYHRQSRNIGRGDRRHNITK